MICEKRSTNPLAPKSGEHEDHIVPKEEEAINASTVSIIFGNLTYYGFQENRIAKKILFWLFFTLTAHLFFALFFSVKYRAILGSYFEPICILNIVIFGYLLFKYNEENKLL